MGIGNFKTQDKNTGKARKSKIRSFKYSHMLKNIELRPIQEEALEWAVKPLIDEKRKFLVFEMPTGTGKSIFANFLIDLYRQNNKGAKADIITNSKILQQQYVDSFSYMQNLWGRSNYWCDNWDRDCGKAKVCEDNAPKDKKRCHECPYKDAREDWYDGDISITNFHILGLYALFVPKILEEMRQSNILIVDEAHLLEETINSFVSFQLNPKTFKFCVRKQSLGQIENDFKSLNNIEEIVDWIENDLNPELSKTKELYNGQLSQLKTAKGKKATELIGNITKIEDLKKKFKKFLDDYKTSNTKWIAEKQVVKNELTWSVQPLWTGEIIRDHLWDKYDHVILMSGTIINKDIFAHVNGIDVNDMAFFSANTPFPKENRPIYYYPIGKMSYKQKEDTIKKMYPIVKKILNKYKGKKGIIHSGNYEVWQWLKDNIKDDRLIFADTTDREGALKEHILSDTDSVIVSPSMMHGVDLKDDASRFQIIMKVPYPSLASKVNKERLNEQPLWYQWRVVSDIVQQYGRSIRSVDDHADTIILDENFGTLLGQYDYLLPNYFLEAIKKVK